MPSVSGTVVVERPPASVFAAIEDPKVQMTFDDMVRGVEQLTDGPIGKGTRFRGNFKGMGTVEYEYAEFEPGRRIVHGVRMPFGGMRHAFELSPEGRGASGATATRLVQSIHAELNLLGKVLWPLMMQRMFRQRIATLNGLIKTFAETHS